MFPKIEGPAAALFDNPPQADDIRNTDPLFHQLGGTDASTHDPSSMKLEILEARLNELYDFFCKQFPSSASRDLPINKIHRYPLDAGLNVQDTSRVVFDTPEFLASYEKMTVDEQGEFWRKRQERIIHGDGS